MAAGTTLFRIEVDLSNVDEGQYERFELRVAQHPSEDLSRVVARTLAYCLVYEPELQWGRGLDEPDEPALFARDANRNLQHWIDVGVPNAERMHKASKAAPRFSIVCHKGKEGLLRERDKRAIHRADKIGVWLLDPNLVAALAQCLQRATQWVVVKTSGELMVTVGESSLSGYVLETTLSEL
jgi:uncharacterized protein YaeQ